MPFSIRHRNSDIWLFYFRSKIIIISNIVTNKTATRVTFWNLRKLFSGLVVSPLGKWVQCISRKACQCNVSSLRAQLFNFLTTIFNAILLHKKIDTCKHGVCRRFLTQHFLPQLMLRNFEEASNSYNVVAINWLPCYTVSSFARNNVALQIIPCNITLKLNRIQKNWSWGYACIIIFMQ